MKQSDEQFAFTFCSSLNIDFALDKKYERILPILELETSIDSYLDK